MVRVEYYSAAGDIAGAQESVKVQSSMDRIRIHNSLYSTHRINSSGKHFGDNDTRKADMG